MLGAFVHACVYVCACVQVCVAQGKKAGIPAWREALAFVRVPCPSGRGWALRFCLGRGQQQI